MNIVNTIQVTPDELEAALRMLASDVITSKLSVMVWGPPGIGKTETVERFAMQRARQYFEDRGIKKTDAELEEWFRDVRLNSLEPPELRGLAVIDKVNSVTRYFPPSFLPTQAGPGVIFLDELTTADKRMQAPSYGLLNERRIGEYKVPDGWMIIAAGNGAEHGAISYDMGTALADRMIHFKVETSVESWLNWGQRLRSDGLQNVDEVVLSYIREKGHYLEMCKERVESEDLIAPSPRGWERSGNILRAYRKNPINENMLRMTLAGTLGQKIASDFILHNREMDSLVKIDQLLASTTDKEIMDLLPRKISALHCMGFSFVSRLNETNFSRILRIIYMIRQIPDSGVNSPELSTSLFEMVMNKGLALGLAGAITKDKTYKEYSKEREEQKLSSGSFRGAKK